MAPRHRNFAWLALAAIVSCGAQQPAPIAVASRVDDLRITAIDELAEKRVDVHDNEARCENAIRIAPKTPAGLATVARGWRVGSEVPFGRYTAVSAFSSAELFPSGVCWIQDGSVLVYDGARLVATVWAPREPDGEAGRIGNVVQAPTPDRVRLLPAGAGRLPMAELVATGEGLRVQRLPEDDAACGGRVRLPNLGEVELLEARRRLRARGWQPLPAKPAAGEFDYIAKERARLPELDGCSGTGWNYCGFAYVHASGAKLDVTTVGENEYEVVDVDIQCTPGK
jgi:hypothetical protein